MELTSQRIQLANDSRRLHYDGIPLPSCTFASIQSCAGRSSGERVEGEQRRKSSGLDSPGALRRCESSSAVNVIHYRKRSVRKSPQSRFIDTGSVFEQRE